MCQAATVQSINDTSLGLTFTHLQATINVIFLFAQEHPNSMQLWYGSQAQLNALHDLMVFADPAIKPQAMKLISESLERCEQELERLEETL